MAKKNRTHIPDELKIKMAMDRFYPMADGNPALSLEILSENYGRAVAVVSRAIKEAIDKKWVVVTVRENLIKIPTRVESLEEKLLTAFPQLRKAVVVSTSLKDSNKIHQALGYSMAKFIHGGGLWIDDGDVIGVGSGRGPYYTTEGLKEFSQARRIPAQNITLVSLTGIISPQAPTPQSGGLFDSDQCARNLIACFSRDAEVTLREIAYPVAPEIED